MCSIVGALLRPVTTRHKQDSINQLLDSIWQASRARGRDGRGFAVNSSAEENVVFYREVTRKEGRGNFPPALHKFCTSATVIGNLRAEPTTEFVQDKHLSDQQPYTSGKWSIVHNGTIANDKALRTHSRASGAASSEQRMIRVWPGWGFTPTRTMKSAYFFSSSLKFSTKVPFRRVKTAHS